MQLFWSRIDIPKSIAKSFGVENRETKLISFWQMTSSLVILFHMNIKLHDWSLSSISEVSAAHTFQLFTFQGKKGDSWRLCDADFFSIDGNDTSSWSWLISFYSFSWLKKLFLLWSEHISHKGLHGKANNIKTFLYNSDLLSTIWWNLKYLQGGGYHQCRIWLTRSLPCTVILKLKKKILKL